MRRRRLMPSAEYLHECFRLDIKTGRLFWRVRPASHFRVGDYRSAQSSANNWNSIWAGQEALAGNDHGYRGGKLGHQKIFAHRVIWKMIYGEEPDTIDHINGDEADNRPSNLRNVSHQQNCQNQRLSSRNKSGVVGVFSDPRRNGRWRVVAPGRGGKEVGCFSDFSEAVATRKAAERAAGYHQNHGRTI